MVHDLFEERDPLAAIVRVDTRCPVCAEDAFGAEGRGYCRACNITFPLESRRSSRKDLMKQFLLLFYVARGSSLYHRAGCKYLKNVLPENLIETSEPIGKPCRCVR